MTRKRGRMPDLDEALAATASVVDAAKKKMKEAANLRRNAQRRRQRYIAKAAKCSNEDLYKIAVYKRTNFLGYLVEQNPEGVKGAMQELVQSGDPESLALIQKWAKEAETSLGPAPGSGGTDNGVAAATPAAVPERTDAVAAAPLPVLPPLPAAVVMPDGSEQIAVPGDSEMEQRAESPERDGEEEENKDEEEE